MGRWTDLRRTHRPDGNFQRCQSVGVLGFGGTLPCSIVNVNNLNGQAPWVGP